MKFEIATIAIALMMGGMVALGVLWGRKFNLIVKENKKLLAELDRNANPPELRYVDTCNYKKPQGIVNCN